jgi:hypothetical protein
MPCLVSFGQAVTDISSQSAIKHGRHRQFLFLIGHFFSSETAWSNELFHVAAMFANESGQYEQSL